MNELKLIAATERRLNQTIETLSEVRAELATKNAAIAAQAAEIERLRAALNEIMVGFIGSKEMREIARAALHPRALAGQDGG